MTNVDIVADSSQFQVTDDLELLDLMLADLHAAPSIYQPTNYWDAYVAPVVEQLRRGLRDFRRNEQLAVFGATDSPPEYSFTLAGDAAERINATLRDALLSDQPLLRRLPLRLTDIVEHAYVRCLFAALASPQVVPIDQLRVSRAGNPFGFRVLGRFFTLPTFGYYLRYAFAAAQVDFSTVDTVVELGSGAGRQAEVLASLHPDLAIVQLDLAPQLYVAERYLTAALPDRVVPYRATRGTGPLRPERGKITFAGNFRLADLCDTGRTLFWNAASFGEMEPAVVEHYASIAGSYAEWLFLHQCFTGKERAGADGHGVLEPVVNEHYERFFGCFTCTAREPAHIGVGYLVEGHCAYEDTFWHRRESPSS